MPPKNLSRGRRVLVLTPMIALLLSSTGVATRASAGSLDDARARLAEHTAYFQSVTSQAQEAQADLAGIQERFDLIEREVRATARDMFDNEETAISWARDLYMGGSMDALEALISSQSLSDVEAQLTYMQFSNERQRVIFEDLFVRRQELSRQLDALGEARSQARAVAAHLADLEADVQARLAEVRSEVASLASELAAELAAAQAAAGVAQSSTTPSTSAASVPGPPYNADWDAIAMCESGGNWHLDSTYDGGLQFHPSTWLGYGGGQYADYAWQASREQQIAIAENVLAGQGPGAWPHCFQE